MSPDALVPLLEPYADQYGLFAIGVLLVFAMGLLFWKTIRKTEVRLNRRLDDVCREVNELKLIESRRFMVALNSDAIANAKTDKAAPSNSSIVPDIPEIQSEGAPSLAVAHRSRGSRRAKPTEAIPKSSEHGEPPAQSATTPREPSA
jgi:hypothetical protein